MAELVRHWKEQQHLPERRVRSDAIREQLQVWDLREGWTGACYERSREKTLRDIAAEIGKPYTTVAERYYSAFEHVVGHPLTAELWCRVVGPLKFAEVLGVEASEIAAGVSRRVRSNVRRPVPESVILPAGADASRPIGQLNRSIPTGPEFQELWIDLRDLIGRGWSNDRIGEELEIPPEAVERFRERFDEFSGGAGT